MTEQSLDISAPAYMPFLNPEARVRPSSEALGSQTDRVETQNEIQSRNDVEMMNVNAQMQNLANNGITRSQMHTNGTTNREHGIRR